MAAEVHTESLLGGVKHPVPEAFKGSMDSKTILNFIYKCKLYFSLIRYLIGIYKPYSKLDCYREQHIPGSSHSSIY